MQKSPTPHRFRLTRTQLLCLITPVVALVPVAHAADVFKANNADNLNLTTSWTGGVLPVATDVAVFDATVAGITPTLDTTVTPNVSRSYMTFPAAASWKGIRVANAAGVNLAIDSYLQGTPGLTIGSAGIDLSAASAGTETQLYGQAVTLGSSQTWTVADGAILDLRAGTLARATGATLTVKLGATGTGVVNPNTMLGAANAILAYATINGSDFAAVNATQTALVQGNTLGTYVANPNTGAVAGSIGSGSTAQNVGMQDVIYSNTITSATAVRIGGSVNTPGFRFNTLHSTGLDWTIDGTGTVRNINIGNGGLLVGPNVGAHNVLFNGASQFRMGANADFYIHQFNTAGDLILNNPMTQSTGTGSRLNKDGPGRVILAGNLNSLGGQTTIIEGTIQVGNGGASGTINSGPIANSGTLAFNRTDAWAQTNVISGAGAIQMLGTGNLTLSGNNTFTGSLSINSGNIAFSTASNLGAATGPINFGGGGLQWTGTNNTDISTRTITLSSGVATLELGANNVTLANSIGNNGTGGITKLGTGNLTLGGANLYAGNTAINAGGLVVTNSTGSATGSGNLTLANTTVLSGTGTVSGSVSVATGGKIKPGVGGVGTLTVGKLNLAAGSLMDLEFTSTSSNDQVVVTDTDGLSLNGAVSLTLNPTGTSNGLAATGNYTIMQYSGSAVPAVNNLSVFNPASGYAYTFDASGGVVTLSVVNNGVIPEWAAGGSGSWGSAANWTDSTAAGGGSNYTAKFQASLGSVATVTLDGDRTTKGLAFGGSGGYIIAQGTGGNLTLDNGVSASGVTVDAGNNTITAPVILNSTAGIAVAANSSLTISGGVSGVGGINKSAAGTLDLTGTNSFSGNVAVAAGVLGFANASSLGSGSLTLNGGALRYDTGNTADISSKVITFAINGATIDTNGNNVVLANTIGNGGTGSFTKSGAGSLTLSGSNTYTGSTAVTGGSLIISSNANLGAEASGAQLSLDGGVLVPTTTLALNNAGANSRALVIGANGGEINVGTDLGFTVSGAMSGTGALLKSGAGNLTLSGLNSGFSGPVTLGSGIVRLGATAANGQSGLGTGTITFGDGVKLYMNGQGLTDNGTSYGALSNALVVATGVTANIYLPQRGGVTGAVSGAGTLNLSVDATRSDINGNWPGFTGVLNISATGAGTDDYRLNADHNMSGATVNLGAGVQVYQVNNPPSSGTLSSIHQFGALNVDAAATLAGNPVGGRYNVYQIGALNTDSVINGQIKGTLSIFGYGYPVITKVGTGTLTINGATNMITALNAANSLNVNAGTLKLMGSIERFYLGSGVDGSYGRDPVSLLCDDTISITPPATAYQNQEPGACVVAVGATLAGNGRFGGLTTINGNLRPDSTGLLGGRLAFTNAATLTLGATATTQIDFSNNVFTGISCDIASGITYGGTLKLNFLNTVYDGSYTLLQSTGGAPQGNFAAVTVTTPTDTDVALTDAGANGIWSGTVGSVTYTFTAATGELAVSGGSAVVLPSAVTGLAATGSNAQVALSWNASTNTDSYLVKRSTVAGGPYTTINNNAALSYTDTGLTNDTTYYYVVEAKNALGLSGNSAEVSATPTLVVLSGLETWRQAQFGVNATNPAIAGDNADPDGDGMANFLEYATSHNPLVADGPACSIGSASGSLTLTYTAIADTKLTYTVQGVNDISGTPAWATVNQTSGAGNVAGSKTVTDTQLISANPRRFLRLNVTYTP